MIETFLLLCAVLMLAFIGIGCGLLVHIKQQLSVSWDARLSSEKTMKECKALIESIRETHNSLMKKHEDTDKRVNDLKFAVEMSRSLKK